MAVYKYKKETEFTFYFYFLFSGDNNQYFLGTIKGDLTTEVNQEILYPTSRILAPAPACGNGKI